MILKVAFIVPYIGKLPNYFQLWLDSCSYNTNFKWFIFTDDKTEYIYPKNVIRILTTFNDIRDRFQSLFQFKICLDKPYKFCDLRPLYAFAFKEYIKDCDFCGYCDLDLIWGNLSKYINCETTKSVDRISEWGHCCLYRNKEDVMSLYKRKFDNTYDYKEVFTSDCNYLFDESGGMQTICNQLNIPTLRFPLFDVRADKLKFHPTIASTDYTNIKAKNRVFAIKDGHVLGYAAIGKETIKEEFAYVHFAKRRITDARIKKENKDYIIIPNKFIDYASLFTKQLKSYQPLCDFNVYHYESLIKNKVDILLGRNTIKWPNSRLQQISDFIHGK